jgi:hypothetical protein
MLGSSFISAFSKGAVFLCMSLNSISKSLSLKAPPSPAAGATDSYVKSLETASEGLSKLTEQYAASASAIAGIAGDGQGNFGA